MFKTFCHIHQNISINMLAGKVKMTLGQAEDDSYLLKNYHARQCAGNTKVNSTSPGSEFVT